MPTPSTEATPFPTRVVYDRSREELTIVVDACPATIDDVSVAAGASRVRIRIERGGSVYDRTVAPPCADRRFADESKAVFNNGVLSVTVGTTRVSTGADIETFASLSGVRR